MSIWKRIKINPANARGFLFFFLLTTLVATLIKLSKLYDVKRTLTIDVVDLPLNRAVHNLDPLAVVVNARVSGFSILRNSLENRTLEISFSDLVPSANGIFEYYIGDYPDILQKSIAVDAEIVSVKPKRVAVSLDSLASGRVEVIPKTNITYAVGYSASSPIKVVPDSITIVGPSKVIEGINFINTKTITQKDISQSIRTAIGFERDSLMNTLKFSDNEVIVSQPVEPFTEGRITVPITVLNDPEGKVKLLPKNVGIVYQVALDSFDRVGASDFLITCDYRKANNLNDYLALKIERQPELVKETRLVTKQVKYVIVN